LLLLLVLFGVLSVIVNIALARAADRGGEAMFREGSMRLSLLIGGARAFNQDYRVYGAGVGYYVIDGLELGLEAETWQGADPRIRRVSPQAMYVFPLDSAARPYVGAFYRKTYIEQYRNLSDAGGRAGLLFSLGRSAYLGVGGVYEKHLACDRVVYESCSESYPELAIAIVF
jgi:hypothetical protein